MLGVAGGFGDVFDRVRAAAIGDRLAALGRCSEVSGEKVATELAALREAAGGEIERDGDGCQDHAEGLTTEADLDAVRRVGDSDGLVSESGNRGGGHDSGEVSKSRTPRRSEVGEAFCGRSRVVARWCGNYFFLGFGDSTLATGDLLT